MRPRNPYVGPRAFGPKERLPNREDEAREVVDLLIAERILLLHSPSGAGKTSLIQAAVIPMLETERFRPLGPVRVDKSVPAAQVHNRYVNSIGLYLLDGSKGDCAELARLDLRQVLDRVRQTQAGSDRPLVLILDQLEEVLVLDPTDWAEKERFFRELGGVLRRERIWALLAMREDYMGGLYRYLPLIPGHLRARYRLDFLTHEEALAAVQKPAAEQGVRFTDEAAHLMVDKLAHTQVQRPEQKQAERRRTPYVEPFQLQVACRRLWQDVRKAKGDNFPEINEADVARTDVDKALSRYYADSIADAERRFGVSQRVLREWFETSLITEQHFRGQTTEPPVPEPAGAEVLRRLREAYLLREDTRGGTTWYELAHDRLISAVLDSNRIWRHANLAAWQRAAYEWQRNNRQRDYLLQTEELRLLPPVTGRHLTDYERDFLRESEEAVRSQGLVAQARLFRRVMGTVAAVELAVIVILIVALL